MIRSVLFRVQDASYERETKLERLELYCIYASVNVLALCQNHTVR